MDGAKPALDDVTAAAVKQVEAAKSFTAKTDLVEHFGEDRVTETAPDEHGRTQYTIDLKTWREVQEFDEMDQPRARLETAAAQAAFAKIPVVLLRSDAGREWEVPEAIAKTLCDSEMGKALGVREVVRRRTFATYEVSGGRVRRVQNARG